MTVTFLLLYALTAAVGALVVGLIGTGASLFILPVLVLTFPLALSGSEDVTLRLAAGTTLGAMCAGAVTAALAQYRAGHVDVRLLALMVPSYFIGALTGPWLSSALSVEVLRWYLGVVLALIALQMAAEKWLLRPSRQRDRDYQQHRIEVRAVMLLVGLCASIAGVASGLFTIPYLNARFALPLRTVIGTSTVAAACYSLFGMSGYISAGWSNPDLPEYALGYLYLPVLALMAVISAFCAPLSVRFAGRVQDGWLKALFALLLLAAAAAILSA